MVQRATCIEHAARASHSARARSCDGQAGATAGSMGRAEAGRQAVGRSRVNAERSAAGQRRQPGGLAAMGRRTAAEREAWGTARRRLDGNAIVARSKRPMIRPNSLEKRPRHEGLNGSAARVAQSPSPAPCLVGRSKPLDAGLHFSTFQGCCIIIVDDAACKACHCYRPTSVPGRHHPGDGRRLKSDKSHPTSRKILLESSRAAVASMPVSISIVLCMLLASPRSVRHALACLETAGTSRFYAAAC
jgi:hypothetical protein